MSAKILSRVQFGISIKKGSKLQYRLDVMLTRFGLIEFFVVDQLTDEIIRQSDRLSAVIDGLPFPEFPPDEKFPVIHLDRVWAKFIESSDSGWLLEDHQGNRWCADPAKCTVI